LTPLTFDCPSHHCSYIFLNSICSKQKEKIRVWHCMARAANKSSHLVEVMADASAQWEANAV